jgi:hypothetical protein
LILAPGYGRIFADLLVQKEVNVLLKTNDGIASHQCCNIPELRFKIDLLRAKPGFAEEVNRVRRSTWR